MLLMLRPFRVGEAVKVSDTSGTVREIGLFRTVMVTDDGLYVSIPNATIFSGTIVNNSREKTRRIAFLSMPVWAWTSKRRVTRS
jgi:small conductance mechanosensitive channel